METSQADFKRTVVSLQGLHAGKMRQNSPERAGKGKRALYGGVYTLHPCTKDKDNKSHHGTERKTMVQAARSGKEIGHL